MTLTVPNILEAGKPAKADQVNENFAAVLADMEGISSAASGTDVYQAGVVASTDWKPGAVSVNSATGVLQLTTFGGAAWLPGAVSGLVRTFQELVTVGGLKPPVLPGNGKYVNVGVELTVSGAGATVSVVSGTEQASEAEGLAHPAAVSAGKIRVRDVVLLNTAGVYSIKGERDRRRWALGAHARLRYSATEPVVSAEETFLDQTGCALRLECAGVPLRLAIFGASTSIEPTGLQTNCKFSFWMDGAAIDGTTINMYQVNMANESAVFPIHFTYQFVPSAGSHLFQPRVGVSGGGQFKIKSSATTPLLFVVQELRPSANNGTT